MTRAAPDTSQALFVDDDELRRRINPKIGRDRFRAIVKDLELRRGFPKTDTIWCGRYWPKVQQWLSGQYDLEDPGASTPAGQTEDEPEFFRQAPIRKRKPPVR